MASTRRGWRRTCARPAAPIRPAPRCSCRSVREPSSERESLRWTMTRRSRPIRASKAARNASTAAGFPTSMPAPQAWARSRQNPTSLRRTPRVAQDVGDRGELVERGPEAAPAAGRVLQHQRRLLGRSPRRFRRRSRPPGREPPSIPSTRRCDARLDARAPMRADVDVDVPRPERSRAGQLPGEHRH